MRNRRPAVSQSRRDRFFRRKPLRNEERISLFFRDRGGPRGRDLRVRARSDALRNRADVSIVFSGDSRADRPTARGVTSLDRGDTKIFRVDWSPRATLTEDVSSGGTWYRNLWHVALWWTSISIYKRGRGRGYPSIQWWKGLGS